MTLLTLLRSSEDAPAPREPTTAARVVSEPMDDTLTVSLTHANGRKSRWAGDEPDVAGIPRDIEIATGAPGGFQTGGCSLARDPRRSWPDLDLLDDIVIQGRVRPLGRSAFEGQTDAFPASLADAFSIGTQAIGYQALLEENESWRHIYVDRDQSRWGSTSLDRKRDLNTINYKGGDGAGSTSVTAGRPAIEDLVEAPFAAGAATEAVYDGGWLGALGSIYYEWEKANVDHTSTSWEWRVAAYTSDRLDSGDLVAQTANLRAAGPGSGTLAVGGRARFAALRLAFDGALAGSGQHRVWWGPVAVYGDNGIPTRGISGEPPGVSGHDALAHMLQTGAPDLNYRVGYDGTIWPADFILRQLAFTDPGKVVDGIQHLNAYYLRNWAVWERRSFWWTPWSPDRLTWRARIQGGAQWTPTGADAERLANGVVVTYTGVDGVRRTAGPPGSNSDDESDFLYDGRQENRATARHRRRWPKLEVGFPLTGGPAGSAIQLGYVWLQEQMRPQRSGTLVVRPLGQGHVPQIEHPIAGPMPVWAARAGDYVELVDYPDPEPFRVIDSRYTHESKTLTLSLDNSSAKISAILERLGVRQVGWA